MAYGDFIHLTWRTASDEILRDEAFNIVKNPKYGGYQKGLPWMFYNFLTKKLLPRVQIDLLALVLKMKISETKN